MADGLEELYELYRVLSEAKDNIDKHSKEYLQCIAATKGNEKQKKLSAQIISKFYKHFPEQQEAALDAILDLCEDEDSLIRVSAMNGLPIICKACNDKVFKVADVLAQMLQLEDKDFTTACNSLTQVFREDPVMCTKAIFHYVNSATDDNSREKNIQFLYKKLVKLQDTLKPELEDLLIEEGKKIIPESTANEFLVIIPFLRSSKLGKTPAGQNEIVDLVAERADLNSDFDPLEDGSHNVDKLIMCVQNVLPLFNALIPSSKFLIYYTDQVLPVWEKIAKIENGELLQLHLLRQLAELSTHCGKLENPSLHVVQIFDKMKDYMPPPPETPDLADLPNLDFTAVESLLYAFHRLARQCQDFLTADPLVLKDFRTRLTYFSRGVQGCKRSLEDSLSTKKTLTQEDSVKVAVAPALLNNINSLIKDLFYQPPVYKCNVTLSFKSEVEKKTPIKTPEKVPSATKRHVPITFDSSSNGSANKQARQTKSGDNVKLYTPPSGKFSHNFPHYRGRGGRGGRGRNSSRNWRH